MVNFDDKEMLNDSLSTQKFITANYNTFANECANPTLRNEALSILNEEHQIQAEFFNEMQSRGFYQVKPADTSMINQARQKYQTM